MKWSTPKADPSLRPVLDAEISQWMSGGAVMLKIRFGLSSSRSAESGVGALATTPGCPIPLTIWHEVEYCCDVGRATKGIHTGLA